MSSQRIVVTSPWKLGLFVFLLVTGCGFGLIYAYLEFFGGTLDFSTEQALMTFYGVCGGVALLGLIGYLAVVAAAQPMDRVVHGGKRRNKLLKAAADVDDPIEVDLENFQDEPMLVRILEHWQEDRLAAQGAVESAGQQRELLAGLASQLSQAVESGVEIETEGAEGSAAALLGAANELVSQLRTLRGGQTQGNGHLASLRSACESGVGQIRRRHEELSRFAAQFAQNAGQGAGAAIQPSAGDSGGAMRVPSVDDLLIDTNLHGACERNRDRIAGLRTQLEGMADQANKLAINSALQVSRLGEQGASLLEAMDELRAISSRFQKLVADLRLCENDQEMTAGQIQSLVVRVQREWNTLAGAPPAAAAASGQPVPMSTSVSQAAQQLHAITTSMGQEIQALESAIAGGAASLAASGGVAGGAAAAHATGSQAPAATPGLSQEDHLAKIHDELFAGGECPVPQGTEPEGEATSASAAEAVHDLADFGAVELPHESEQSEERIYNLSEFGAVEL